MTQFSEAAWQRTARLRAGDRCVAVQHRTGRRTLSRERFQGYIIQDALYLAQYSRILAIAGARGPDAETLRTFGSCALEAVAVEQALHERYLTEFGVDPAQIAEAEPSPDCLGYTSFLLATAYHEPWEVLVAALLPCFWIYWDVGSRLPGTLRRTIPIAPGSTPTRTKPSVMRCATSSASPIAPRQPPRQRSGRA